MRVRAALLREVPGKWEVNQVELDAPREGEVLVRIAANGLCHSDDHFATGDIEVGRLPLYGGHEASGVVEEINEGYTDMHAGLNIRGLLVP